jgi:hypothetical protein
MPSNDKRDYEVGYGKPPRYTRFKKGQSGNPRGRPSDAKNLSSLLDRALNEPVFIIENGRRRKVSKRRAFINRLVDRAAEGDLRAGKILLDIYPGPQTQRRRHRPRPPPSPTRGFADHCAARSPAGP